MHLLSYIHSICSESFLMLPVYSHPTHTYPSQHVSQPPACLWKSGSSVPCPPLFSIHFLMFSPPPSFIVFSFLLTICKWVCLQCVGDSGMTRTSDPPQCHLQCGPGPSPHFVTPTRRQCGWHRDESEDSVGDAGMGLKTSLQDLQGLTAPLLLPALHFHPVLLHRLLSVFPGTSALLVFLSTIPSLSLSLWPWRRIIWSRLFQCNSFDSQKVLVSEPVTSQKLLSQKSSGSSQFQIQAATLPWLWLGLCMQYPRTHVLSSLETHGPSSPSKGHSPWESFPNCPLLKGILLSHKDISCSICSSQLPPREQMCLPWTLTKSVSFLSCKDCFSFIFTPHRD